MAVNNSAIICVTLWEPKCEIYYNNYGNQRSILASPSGKPSHSVYNYNLWCQTIFPVLKFIDSIIFNDDLKQITTNYGISLLYGQSRQHLDNIYLNRV